MKVHFREQYGTRGDEVLYVVPVGEPINRFRTSQLIFKLFDLLQSCYRSRRNSTSTFIGRQKCLQGELYAVSNI